MASVLAGESFGVRRSQREQADAPASSPRPEYRAMARGACGLHVRELQRKLVSLGYLTSADAASGPGVFGPRTEAAVINFQDAHGLRPTGQVGKHTHSALDQALSRPARRHLEAVVAPKAEPLSAPRADNFSMAAAPTSVIHGADQQRTALHLPAVQQDPLFDEVPAPEEMSDLVSAPAVSAFEREPVTVALPAVRENGPAAVHAFEREPATVALPAVSPFEDEPATVALPAVSEEPFSFEESVSEAPPAMRAPAVSQRFDPVSFERPAPPAPARKTESVVSECPKAPALSRPSAGAGRSAATYAATINRFEVTANPRYVGPGAGVRFAQDVMGAMNAELPSARSANELVSALREHGAGWSPSDAATAQQYANTGRPAIAATTDSGNEGVLAVVRPGTLTASGPTVAHAGARNFNHGHAARAFGAEEPEYFVHT